MYLPDALAARRVCVLAGQIYWVRPLSVEGWATLLAWLDDFVPGREERPCPPAMGEQATQEKLESPACRALLVWLSLEETGLSFSQAAQVADGVTDEERGRFYTILFARRRTYESSGAGGDISETWCGKGWAQSAIELGMSGLGKLSLDQLDWIGSNGECDGEHSPSAIGLRRANEMYDEAMKRQNGTSAEVN